MEKVKCPVPGCEAMNQRKKIISHMRQKPHSINLLNRRGGNLLEQRQTHAREYGEWLKANGYRIIDVSFFADVKDGLREKYRVGRKESARDGSDDDDEAEEEHNDHGFDVDEDEDQADDHSDEPEFDEQKEQQARPKVTIHRRTIPRQDPAVDLMRARCKDVVKELEASYEDVAARRYRLKLPLVAHRLCEPYDPAIARFEDFCKTLPWEVKECNHKILAQHICATIRFWYVWYAGQVPLHVVKKLIMELKVLLEA